MDFCHLHCRVFLKYISHTLIILLWFVTTAQFFEVLKFLFSCSLPIPFLRLVGTSSLTSVVSCFRWSYSKCPPCTLSLLCPFRARVASYTSGFLYFFRSYIFFSIICIKWFPIRLFQLNVSRNISFTILNSSFPFWPRSYCSLNSQHSIWVSCLSFCGYFSVLFKCRTPEYCQQCVWYVKKSNDFAQTSNLFRKENHFAQTKRKWNFAFYKNVFLLFYYYYLFLIIVDKQLWRTFE